MKLVELLARELSEWPESAVCITQDSGGAIYGWVQTGAEYRGYAWYSPDGEDFGMHYIEIEDPYKASDNKKSVVTQAEWQAERVRQKGGEWKRHRGGAQPKSVSDSDMVEVHLRCGDTQTAYAGNFLWNHADCDESVNITKYRVISQPQAEEVEESADKKWYEPAEAPDTREYKGPFPCAPAGEPITELEWDIQFQQGVFHMESKTDQIDGPIKWRDTVNELDAYIEEFTREREALINRLALEGFALIPAMTAVMGVTDELPTFRDWMVGDIVEVISTENFADTGLRVGEQMPIVDTDSRDGTVKVVSGSWGDEDNYKFIRRP